MKDINAAQWSLVSEALDKLLDEASRFQPYSDNPDAPLIDPALSRDITATRDTIERHEGNLKRFEIDEAKIKKQFDIDINRFKRLKGLDVMMANPVDSVIPNND